MLYSAEAVGSTTKEEIIKKYQEKQSNVRPLKKNYAENFFTIHALSKNN
jgi:hypothetical protein